MKTTILDTIKAQARALSACERLEAVQSERELIDLFFTPQGLEFCQTNDYCPMVEDLQALALDSRVLIKPEQNRPITTQPTMLIAGGGNYYLTYKKRDDGAAHTLVLARGASATLLLSRGALLNVYLIGGDSEVNISGQGHGAMVIIRR